MQIGEIMERRVVTVGPKETASAAWTRMRRRDVRHLVVKDGAAIVGVLSERDLGGRTGRALRKGRTVSDLMTPSVVTAPPDMTLPPAADLMRSRLIGSLPVVEDDELVGIVTATDVFDALGGEATGAPKSPTPEPFAARVPRPVKTKAGRTAARQIPANIRVAGTALTPDERASIRRELGAKLGKFAGPIERVTVRVRDVNGPRGGIDKACRIKVVLSGLPSVIVEEQAASLERAFRDALAGTVRSVRRAVQRRRTKPRRRAGAKRVEPRD